MYEYSHVTQSNHANRLPNAETDARGYSTVETLNAVGIIDVLERVADSHLLGAVRVVLLALHLDADDLDGLVPGGETTTDGGSQDLLHGGQLLAVLLVGDLADALLGEAGETEAGAPVGHLADGDGVDTLVDATDALAAVDAHEGRPCALGLHAGGGHLVLGDLDRLHAGAEAHGRVRLRNTTRHTADDATAELAGARVPRIVFGLGRDEEKHGALGGGFDPGPWDETLVDCGCAMD